MRGITKRFRSRLSVAGPKAPSLLPTSKCRTVYRRMKPGPTVLLVGRYFAGEILGFHIKNFGAAPHPTVAPKDHKKGGGTRTPRNAIARQHRAMHLREIGGLRQCGHSIGVGWARVKATSQGSWVRSPNQHRRAAPTAVGNNRKLSNRTKRLYAWDEGQRSNT